MSGYDFFIDPGHLNMSQQEYVRYMGCGWSHSSVNKFLDIIMSKIKSAAQMENSFLHFDTLPFQNTQIHFHIWYMNWQWEVRLHGNHHQSVSTSP